LGLSPAHQRPAASLQHRPLGTVPSACPREVFTLVTKAGSRHLSAGSRPQIKQKDQRKPTRVRRPGWGKQPTSSGFYGNGTKASTLSSQTLWLPGGFTKSLVHW